MTSVKNQESCGSCWCFAATGVIESQLCKNNQYDCNSWEGLSPQQCVDCASCDSSGTNPITGNVCSKGCSGGNSQNFWYYVFLNQGVNDWTDYPYTATENTCAYDADLNIFDQTTSPPQNIQTVEDVCLTCKNEYSMMSAINTYGPIKVSIYVNNQFRHYAGGVFDGNCPTAINGSTNHAVVATGYGSAYTGSASGSPEVDFWYIKNTWGEDWGIDGYVKYRRNTGQRNGVCSVSAKPYFTVITPPGN